jgi:small GTP-binding protein
MSDLRRISKKIVLLGDPGVGKTSMIRRFVYDIFDDKYITTLGMKVTKKQLVINHPIDHLDMELTLMIWDLMGQKEYQFLHKSTYRGTDGAIIVCDFTRKDTLDNIPEWVTNLFNVTGNIPIVIIGNKNDLNGRKKFSFEEISELAKVCKATVFMTSAKTGENVELVFSKLSEDLIVDIEPIHTQY